MVKTRPTTNHGFTRYEGIPLNSSYEVVKTPTKATWVTGSTDVVTQNGSSTLTFNTSSWNITQSVTIVGLDDLIDDGDQDFLVEITLVSDLDEKYNTDYFDPSNPIIVPMSNVDNEDTSFVVRQIGTACSEPFYDLSAIIQFYVTSKPTDVIVLSLRSSDPSEAGPSDTLVSISPEGWDTATNVTVSSVDDFVDDGNASFTVTVDLFYSADSDYQSVDYSNVFSFTSFDDPNDEVATSSSKMTISLSSGSYSYTTEDGGSATLDVMLNYKPQVRSG